MKAKVILLVTLLVLVWACEKESVFAHHSILGDWAVQSCLVSRYVSGTLVNESLVDYLTQKEVIRFMENGTGVRIYDGMEGDLFAWKLDDIGHNLLIVEGIGEVLSYKVQIGADTLLYENESVYNIETTRTRLVLSYVAFRVN